jgi:uncharacterized protein
VSRSALYSGWVTHRRELPIGHRFRYRVAMVLLDLDELPEVLDRHPLWSARRPAPVRFRRADHLGDPHKPLADSVRDLVGERTGRRVGGPVRLLTTLRFCGLGYNPVSFYYLHSPDGTRVEAMVAEVTNTPWGERHEYVMLADSGDRRLTGTFSKQMHVSPFMPMDQTYCWSATPVTERLAVTIAAERAGVEVFEASLALRRTELSRRAMTRAMVSHPPAAATTLARIYANAVRLKLKGAPYHPHPASG